MVRSYILGERDSTADKGEAEERQNEFVLMSHLRVSLHAKFTAINLSDCMLFTNRGMTIDEREVLRLEAIYSYE
jgi:hypothetical protein